MEMHIIIRNLYMDMPSPVADGEKIYIHRSIFHIWMALRFFDLGIEGRPRLPGLYIWAGLSTFVKNQTSVSHCYVTGRFFLLSHSKVK